MLFLFKKMTEVFMKSMKIVPEISTIRLELCHGNGTLDC